jgi:hypothetical protein
MKTKKFVLIALLTVAVLILAACQQQGGASVPADPVEAVKLIADKQKDIKSEHLDVTLDLTLQLAGLDSSTDPTAAQMSAMFKNFKASATLNGDVDSAQNNFQLSGSADLGPFTAMVAQGADKLTFDLVKVGDTMYSRALGKDWSSTNVASTGGASASTSISATQASAQLAEILKKAAKAEKLGDESIDGADSYHYKVTINPVDMLTQAANIAKSTGSASAQIDQAQIDQATALLKDSTIEVEMWVGKADLLIRQEKIHLNFNIKNIPGQTGASALLDLSILAKITKINQPLTITAPK